MSDVNLSTWSGAPRPERIVLEGAYARLEPLDAGRHAGDLLRSALEDGADERFRYLFEAAPSDQPSFARWLEGAAVSQDPLFFAVVDKATGRAEGRQSLMRIDPAHGVIEIGHILWGPAIARSRVTTEAFFLFASYVFDTLGYRRLEWKCNDRNLPSRRAAARFGFTFEGIFRNHMVVKGENRNTAWFSIVGPEWPRLSAALSTWLDASNFDEAGHQRRRLEDCRT
jgi:RimJ/RimL family protein N-acetyltransferase